MKCEYCGRDSKTNKGIANCIGIGLHSWTLKKMKPKTNLNITE